MTAPYARDLIRRFSLFIAICALFVGIGVGLANLAFFPIYMSTAVLQLVFHTSISAVTVDRVANNEVVLATSPSVLGYVAAAHPPLTVAHLQSDVTAAVTRNTEFVQITAEDTSGARAASIANAVAQELVATYNASVREANAKAQAPLQQQIGATQQQFAQTTQQLTALGSPPSDPAQAVTLQSQLAAQQSQLQHDEAGLQQIQVNQANSAIDMKVSESAQPGGPLLTRVIEAALAGVIGGALLGLLLVFALDWLDWRVRTPEEVVALLGAPALGEINRIPQPDGQAEDSEITFVGLQDTFQSLARSIAFLGMDHPIQTIAILSPERATASQTVASGLAIYTAASGRRTLLVDGHLGVGQQSRQFGIPNSPGLSNMALDARSVGAQNLDPITYARQPTFMRAPNLLVLPSGSIPPNADQTLASRAMQRILAALPTSGAEVVLLDTLPLLDSLGASRGAQALLQHADGALVVVDLQRTRKHHLLRTRNLLAEAETPVIGCVVVSPPEPLFEPAQGVAPQRVTPIPMQVAYDER